MIKANSKPLEEIWGFVEGCKKVLVLGCGGCVTVCHVGGEKEVGVLAEALRLKAKTSGAEVEFVENTVQRVCEPEFVQPVLDGLDGLDAIVSISCGVGVNHLADRGCPVSAYPGVDTTFMGSTVEHGVWEEKCGGCGKCILNLTGGLCPVARCAKGILNGPCGGTTNGMCEISSEEHQVPCVWAQIVERLITLGALDKLTEVQEPKDWSASYHGGLRRRVREDLMIAGEDDEQEAASGA
jgi:ferredoxin